MLAPLGWVLTIGIVEGVEFSNKFRESDLQKLGEKLDKPRQRLGIDIRFQDDINDVETAIESFKLEEGSDLSQEAASKLRYVTVFENEFNQLQKAIESFKLEDRPQLESDSDQKWSDRIHQKWIDRINDEKLGEKWRQLSTTVIPAADITEEGEEEEKKEEKEQNAVKLVALINDLQGNEATAEQVDEYNSLVETLELDFQLAKQKLFGGPGWATIVELANPSESQFESLQQRAQELLRDLLFKITGKTTSIMGSLAMQLFILSVAIYYFLIDGPEMVNAAMHLSPMDDRYEKEMIAEFAKLSRAVVVATLLSAIAQGILAGIGYFFCWQFESLFVLMILTTVLAMVPFVGAAAIWVPCCIYLGVIEERPMAAIMLGLYGFFIISMADNIIKPMVLKGQSNLHPLFALLSVIGGVQALGPVGVLVGPMLVAFLQSLLKLLNRDLGAADESALQST